MLFGVGQDSGAGQDTDCTPDPAPSSATERLEVVNEANEVMGTASRQEIHRRGLMHRSAHVFLLDGRGRLFLQRRGRDKDRYPLRYDSSAAGHLGVGETYRDCADRELLEELGVSAPLEMLASFSACAELGWEHIELYSGTTDKQVRVNKPEVDGGRFLPLPEIERMIARQRDLFTPDFVHLFSWYLRHVRPVDGVGR